MRLGLMRNANLISTEFITKLAGDLRLDSIAFDSCRASTRYDADIQAETAEAATLGVIGTPTFVVGRSASTVVEGPMIVGAVPYLEFDAKLRQLLESVKK